MDPYHDEDDSLSQLISDAEESGHTPDSVRESAQRELSRRGYSKSDIDCVRIHGHLPDD